MSALFAPYNITRMTTVSLLPRYYVVYIETFPSTAVYRYYDIITISILLLQVHVY